MTNLGKKWEEVLYNLRNEFTQTAMEAWIEPLNPKSFEHDVLTLESHNEYIIEMVTNRYLQIMEDSVKKIFGPNTRIKLTVQEKRPIFEQTPESLETDENYQFKEEFYLNPKFNFDTFVVGKNSEFAYAAARAVAEAPSKQYNPLYIHGTSGLGKTHLMHAIGSYILEHNNNKKVLYVSSETFTNELIGALRNKKMQQFRNKYRQIDVLLIDDIQFIEGKDSTQEEFFNTFNALYDCDKQIIISSDRSPYKLKTLDERLTSRFSWGLTTDIQAPDYETRVAILINKAKSELQEITPELQEVINLIASNIKYNVRELEGALTRIISFSTLMDKPINMKLAKETLQDIIKSPDNRYTVNAIKRTVAKYYGITEKDLESTVRARKIAYPRQIAMYLIKELTENSLPKIGESFGGRDHTTVLYAHKKIAGDLENNEELENQLEEIKDILMN